MLRIRTLFTTAFALFAIPLAADTGFVREFAKNETPVRIVAIGRGALETAEELRGKIVRHPEYQRRKTADSVRVIGMHEVEEALAGEGDTSVVFVIATRAMEALPSSVAGRVPARLSDIPQEGGIVHAELTRSRPLAFAALIAAPDIERLRKAMDVFTSREVNDFRDLGLTQQFTSNRIAIFGSAPGPNADNEWGFRGGRAIWNDIRRFSLEEREGAAPADLAGRDEVYFLDRSGEPRIPRSIRAMVEEAADPTMILVARTAKEDGGHIFLFSAPNGRILRRLAQRFPHTGVVEPTRVEAVDLRRFPASGILIHGSVIRIGPSQTERIRYRAASDIRRILGLEVREFGREWERLQNTVASSSMQDAIQAVKSRGPRLGIRHVWLFELHSVAGAAEFRPEITRLTRDPAPYDSIIPAPSKPKRDDGEREKAIYDRRLEQWKLDRETYARYLAREAPVDWRVNVMRDSHAEVSGVLRLVDIQTGKIIWSRECAGRERESQVHRAQEVTMRGFNARPSLPDLPSREYQPPAALAVNAALAAASTSLESLEAVALLPGDVPLEDG